MSEVHHPDPFEIQPTREERVRVFLGDHLNAQDKEDSYKLAALFQDRDKPMAPTAVLIPVAAHQDSGLVLNSMEQYARQSGHKDFSIFMLFNSPLKIDATHEYDRTIRQAQAVYPSLDIRGAYVKTDDFSIGDVRRILWNGVLTLAYHEGLTAPGSPDVIGINHDIDTISMSPHYIKRIQTYYDIRQKRAASVGVPEAPLRPAGTRVSHAVLPTHPNVGKVTQWIDNTYFQQPGHGTYEAGYAIPFSHYALLGGFDATDQTHETRWVSAGVPVTQLVGAQLYTSPRRYIDRIAENGTDGIWTPGSFGAADDCRKQFKPDITLENAEDLILERLDRDMPQSWMRGVLDGVYQEVNDATLSMLDLRHFQNEITTRAETLAAKQHAKAVRFLRKIVQSELLADILESGFDPKGFAREQINSLILFNQDWDKEVENNNEQILVTLR